MQNGSRKMTDTRYTSVYNNKTPITTHREQLSADICRQMPSDRKEPGKPVSNSGKGKL